MLYTFIYIYIYTVCSDDWMSIHLCPLMEGWQNLKNRVKNKIQPNHNVFYQVKQLSSLKSQLQMVQMGLLCLKRAGALEAVERSMRR